MNTINQFTSVETFYGKVLDFNQTPVGFTTLRFAGRRIAEMLGLRFEYEGFTWEHCGADFMRRVEHGVTFIRQDGETLHLNIEPGETRSAVDILNVVQSWVDEFDREAWDAHVASEFARLVDSASSVDEAFELAKGFPLCSSLEAKRIYAGIEKPVLHERRVVREAFASKWMEVHA